MQADSTEYAFRRACLLVLFVFLLAAPATASASGRLLVLDGNSGTLTPRGGDRFDLEIHGIDNDVTWFADRPIRRAGSLTLRQVVRDWKKMGFVTDPPNAAIELLDGKAKADTLIVELGRPRLDAEAGILRVRARRITTKSSALAGHATGVDRSLPRHFGRISLFVDNAATYPTRSITLSVINNSRTDIVVAENALTGGQWDQAPVFGAHLWTGSDSVWVNGTDQMYVALGGSLTLATEGGGTISINWAWEDATPSVTVSSAWLYGTTMSHQLLNAATSSPTLQLTLTNGP
ncbi:MAG: hypothetical protein JHC95_19540 [Solirubrobacteraceae bacterium]|nr:hypothetical protein [Solirubrobacteraceae bacterium]